MGDGCTNCMATIVCKLLTNMSRQFDTFFKLYVDSTSMYIFLWTVWNFRQDFKGIRYPLPNTGMVQYIFPHL